MTDCQICFRVILNVMYTMLETIRVQDENDPEEFQEIREIFRYEISKYALQLFNMILFIII